jgi:CBS domain-containing protein
MLPIDDPVRAITAFEPVTAHPGQTLRQLAATMTEAQCSAVLLELRDGSRAIVTERDIVRAVAQGASTDQVWATDVMSRELVEIDADTTIGDAAEVMTEAGIRHLVVTDSETGHFGIISIRDLLGPFLESFD